MVLETCILYLLYASLLGLIGLSAWVCALKLTAAKAQVRLVHTEVQAEYWKKRATTNETFDDLVEQMITNGVREGHLDPSWYDKDAALEWASGEILKRVKKKKKLPAPAPSLEIAVNVPAEDRWDQI